MSEKIMTLHPAGKQGVNINKEKYEMMRQTILEILREKGTVRFQELPIEVGNRIGDRFDGSIGWYTTTVKLDLEARGEIERVPKKSPQQLRLLEK